MGVRIKVLNSDRGGEYPTPLKRMNRMTHSFSKRMIPNPVNGISRRHLNF